MERKPLSSEVSHNRVCPGCGLTLAISSESLPDPRLNISAECWRSFCRLSETTTAIYGELFIHQLAIDTYEAQHGGGTSKDISVVFGLVGLYLNLEKGYSGRRVQKAHMLLARQNKQWPRLEPPTYSWNMTVADVVNVDSRDEILRRIPLWAKITWEGWIKERQTIIGLVEHFLYRG